jgi:hypothetical protein
MRWPIGRLRQAWPVTQVIIAGHTFVQYLRRGHHEIGLDAPPAMSLAAALTGLARSYLRGLLASLNASAQRTTQL